MTEHEMREAGWELKQELRTGSDRDGVRRVGVLRPGATRNEVAAVLGPATWSCGQVSAWHGKGIPVDVQIIWAGGLVDGLYVGV
jgi:hypothetical protein